VPDSGGGDPEAQEVGETEGLPPAQESIKFKGLVKTAKALAKQRRPEPRNSDSGRRRNVLFEPLGPVLQFNPELSGSFDCRPIYPETPEDGEMPLLQHVMEIEHEGQNYPPLVRLQIKQRRKLRDSTKVNRGDNCISSLAPGK
jgi:hypothetical protein